ncbi:hypothetical protein [Listeria costaricensis]|uniref:hypothetical protein n=1 Tax=Listeria costaricensis TaxID=2026604 RepID=UPI000C06878E|nr:hypothetical protein [Listeria costaricensis]
MSSFQRILLKIVSILSVIFVLTMTFFYREMKSGDITSLTHYYWVLCVGAVVILSLFIISLLNRKNAIWLVLLVVAFLVAAAVFATVYLGMTFLPDELTNWLNLHVGLAVYGMIALVGLFFYLFARFKRE